MDQFFPNEMEERELAGVGVAHSSWQRVARALMIEVEVHFELGV